MPLISRIALVTTFHPAGNMGYIWSLLGKPFCDHRAIKYSLGRFLASAGCSVSPFAVPPTRCRSCTPERPTFRLLAAFSRNIRPRGKICIGRVVGALLVCGRRLSLPSPRRPAFPKRLPSLHPIPAAHAAHTRPNALTLHSPGFVLLYGRARPATLSNCAGIPLYLAFPRLVRSATLRAHPRRPRNVCAPLRSAHTPLLPACERFPTVGRRGRARPSGR